MSYSSSRKRIALLAACLCITGQAAAKDAFDTFGDTCIASGTSYNKAIAAVNARNPTQLPDDADATAKRLGATTTYLLEGGTPVLVTLNERGYCAVMAEATEQADLQAQLAAYIEGLKQTKSATEHTDAESDQLLALWEVDWSPELAMVIRLVKGSAGGVEGVMLSRAFVAK